MLPKLASLSLAAFAFLTLGVTAASAQYTTRIEPKPFYGATVTLEEGVRVIRPLPPERHVIINPGNATPLSLGFNDTRIYENRVVRNYNYNADGVSTSSYRNRYGYYAGAYGLGRYGGHYLVPRWRGGHYGGHR